MKVFNQKFCLRLICKIIYFLGLGNFWYEDFLSSAIAKKIYTLWSYFIYFYLLVIYVDQWLSFFRDLSEKEFADFIVILVSNTVILTKTVLFLILKKRLRPLFKKLLEDENLTEDHERASVIKSLRYCITFSFTVYFVLASYTVIAVKEMYRNGAVLNLEVVRYPTPASPGVFASFLRPVVAFHWWLNATIMTITDDLCIFTLVIAEYRFKSLQIYFENLGKKVEGKIKDRLEIEVIREEYYRDFVEGIRMHNDALWCARHIQSSLGLIYSVQILSTIMLLTINLLRIVSIPRPIADVAPDLMFVAGVLLLCGTFMNTSGDITHEASQLSMCMMHSGVLEVGNRRVRTLVLIAMVRAQSPVHMTAFGLLHLTQRNFISVIRSSYSFYAVMH